MEHLYIQTTLSIPGVGSVIHVAELREIGTTHCIPLRMIEMTGDEVIMGTFNHGQIKGQISPPQEEVPHPDTYGDFPDISHRTLSVKEFNALWAEAEAILEER